METRLRAKRKEKDLEAAKLESQVLTRSAVKKARAAGIPAPLLQKASGAAPPITGVRSHRKPRTREEEVKQEDQPQAAPPSRFRGAGTERIDHQPDPRQAADGKDSGQGEAGPSAPRPGQGAAQPDQQQDESAMDRRRREENEAAQAREGADDEVRSCMLLRAPSHQAMLS
jgi:hypothetical protein